MLGPADLSRRGWRFGVGGDGGTAVIAGRVVETSALRGVIVRLVAVTAAELPAIHPEDRAYAAAEMHAFLLAWLDALPCPVLNRPLPVNLSGVPSGTEAWNVRARRLGIAARALRRVVNVGVPSPPPVPEPRAVSVDVVGSRAFTGPARRERARRTIASPPPRSRSRPTSGWSYCAACSIPPASKCRCFWMPDRGSTLRRPLSPTR